MFLPSLAPYPFAAIGLLFGGPQTGPELRRALCALGHPRTAPSFSRAMANLCRLRYVVAQYVSRPGDVRPVRELQYAATDRGVLAWTDTQKFFANFPPPSPGFSPPSSDFPPAAGPPPAPAVCGAEPHSDLDPLSDLDADEYPHLAACLALAKRERKREKKPERNRGMKRGKKRRG